MIIDKQNDGVAFNDAEHVYWNLESGIKYISVTTLIEKFGKPFDKEFWSAYKALEKILDADYFKVEKKRLLDTHKFDKDYYLKTYSLDETKFNSIQQDILDQWHLENQQSCERGTAIHAGIEHDFLDSGSCELQKYGIGGKFNVRSGDVPLDEEKGVYPEYLIHVDDGDLHLAGQIDLLIKDGSDIYIYDWKGLPLETKIPTLSGWSTIKDIKEGDIIFDKDGNPTKILHKSEVHNNPCYKITFDNGDSIIADHEHRWLISFSTPKLSKYHGEYREEIMTTEDIFNYLKTLPKNRSSYDIPKILNPKPLNLPEANLPIDPYVLGCWLGDGSKQCGAITNETNNVLGEIQRRGYQLGNDISEGGTPTHTILEIYSKLKELNLVNNKHIPDIYQRASYNQRLDLLRGLMDTDGYYNPIRKRFVMETSQEWQCYDFIKLLASLGIKATKFDITKKLNGKRFHEYSINFSTLGLNPFLMRNINIDFPLKDNCSYRNIIKVELVDTVETQCLEVDSSSHTFLCTEQMIVTHNTNKKIETKGFFNSKTKSTEKMKYPLSDMDECNFSHYTLQLSMYAWMIQHNHPEFSIKRLKLVHFDHEGNRTEYEIEYKKSTVERLIRYWKKQGRIEERKELRKPIEF